MRQDDEYAREIAALRDRLARLSEASLRITEDLDLGAVLEAVVDGARSLTGARAGGITTLDDDGQLQDFITSGLTDEDHQRFVDLPGGPEFFAYLSGLAEPLRLSDFSGHTESAGLPEITPPLGPVATFLGTPIRLRGRHVGNLYLSDKGDGAEFTAEDEETLVLFASQAATAIANARQHREERRARAGLEALVNTSPVGVVVFAAKTGDVVSLNREARRIVDGLRNPDQSVEELLEVLSFRRADGREISLEEFPLAQALGTGETVRAEEIVIGVPDGRSVTVLLNATPILSDEDEVESVVVTLQDLTPLEEAERLRAEFLAMVSHELRVPLTSIKGSIATLLGLSSNLDPVEARQFHRIIDQQADRMREMISDLLDVARIETGMLPIAPEPTSVMALVEEARTAFVTSGGGGNLRINLPPDLPLVMADRRRMVQVLGNLLSNAARHSPETSVVTVSALRQGGHVAVSVADQGQGIAAERLPRLFRKFSPADDEDREHTAEGSGLGLAICRGIVEAHGGRIWGKSDGPGLGSRFTFTVPAVEEAASPAAPSSRRPRTESERTPILAVDDDPQTLRYVRDALAKAGYAPVVTADPADVPRLMEEEKPRLVLLDLLLPGTDGIALMKDVLGGAGVPVIFLSAYGRDEVIARAFDMGAVDYVVKPFSPAELVARIRTALRRRAAPEWGEPSEPYTLGDLAIDYAERKVTVGSRAVHVTATEYEVLVALSASAGRVLTHDHLLQRVWGTGNSGDPRLVRTVVKRLRRKLGDDADSPKYIFTEPHVGYRMARAEEPD